MTKQPPQNQCCLGYLIKFKMKYHPNFCNKINKVEVKAYIYYNKNNKIVGYFVISFFFSKKTLFVLVWLFCERFTTFSLFKIRLNLEDNSNYYAVKMTRYMTLLKLTLDWIHVTLILDFFAFQDCAILTINQLYGNL